MEYLETKPLKNCLEQRATTWRTIRSLQLLFTFEQYALICSRIFLAYKGDPELLTRVGSRVRGGYSKKVVCYPPEFIPTMVEVIQASYKEFNPKPKRPRIVK